ncbi:hypothetical protein ALQ57_101525 [Pseudomonas amygdali pv. hibisci]|nr:hypothetical protein ALO67_101500 [Pseudomonas amygdali pv. hibisci]RMN55664.1 hypothetical protein ALQ57_101525 [Pseudomonas amygdali pv. hibisci]RMV61317.1 hypothetical protein ALP09_102874 [Pseudomonas amygdali pv. lachrymans]
MYGFTGAWVCTKTRQTDFRQFRNAGHAFMFADDVQFEHAFRFVTKAYDVFLSTAHNFKGYTIIAALLPYRMCQVRAIMTTACDHACRTELH